MHQKSPSKWFIRSLSPLFAVYYLLESICNHWYASSISKYSCIHMYPMSRTTPNRPFLKMVAILALGRIWNVPISKCLCKILPYQCAKFHAWITKGTFLSHICWTKRQAENCKPPIFYVFGVPRSGIEPRPPAPRANALTTMETTTRGRSY